MGRDRNKHSSRKHKRSSRDRPISPSAALDSKKVLKYASLGKTRKLRALLGDRQNPGDLLNSLTDRDGATALHQAARHGQVEVVQLLLRRSADPCACDAAGNTPGHLAAMHGQWMVLTELIKAADIDLDQPNTAGFTIREIVQQQKQQEQTEATDLGVAASEEGPGAGSPTSSYDSKEEVAAAAASTQAAATASSHGHCVDEDDWMDKLAYEMSYDDHGGFAGAWGSATAAAGAGRSVSPTAAARPTSKRAPAAAAGDNDGDDDADDAWADRLWQDMQEHRRAAAAAARSRRQSGSTGSTGVFGAGPGRDEAARERERKAAAAAAESARILKEEQAKDADWRAAMMRQVEEAALPLRRTTYEGRWQQLEAWPAGKPIRYQDIPWPCPTPGSQAAARKQQQQQEALQLDPQQLRTLVLAGAKSAADIKLALRKELMRWHPDKFTARYGARLLPADKDAIHAGVHEVAQQLTAIKQQ